MSSDPDDSRPSEDRSRSVNDFDSGEALRQALRSREMKTGGFVDVGRDFPRSLIGSAPHPGDEDSMSESSSVAEPLTGELDWVLTNYNAEISQTQSLVEEMKRLQVLRSYLLLDSQREPSFERLTALASRMFRVPIALVSLVDLGRQWFMSNRGLGDVRETPRKLAFCAHAILSKEDLLIVPDASVDPRFMDNPLVTGPPNIRFYAGAPLMCPEGYRLGTLCIIDDKTRLAGMSFEEKQNLRELADLVVDAMVRRRQEKLQVLQDKSQIIACTAHDLLTPLSGVQMSLSLLLEDEDLQQRLSDSQKELIATAGSCSDVMNRICHHAIDTFRLDVAQHHQENEIANKDDVGGPKVVVIEDMVKKLKMVMEPYPKLVPVSITVDPSVPPRIIADDLKIFRSAINYLTNACKKTDSGSVMLRIFVSGKRKRKKVVFECEDTGPGVPVGLYEYLFRPFRDDDDDNSSCLQVGTDGKLKSKSVCRPTMANSGLGLYSVAHQISSIGGEYGFRPRQPAASAALGDENGGAAHREEKPKETTGAVFWFSFPLILPGKGDLAASASSADGMPFDGPPTRRVEFDLSNLKYLSSNLSRSSSDPAQPLIEQTAIRQGTDALLQQAEDLAKRITTMATSSNSSENDDDVNMMPPPAAVAEAPRPRQSLVIDDSVVIRKSTQRALSKLGFDVTVATNGLEGLKEMQEQTFDLVLCDFLMPVMDGLDCVQQYRDWEKIHRPWFQQYIVGISAHASPNDVEKGRLTGMNDFKTKPVTLNMLKDLQNSRELKAVSDKLDQLALETRKHGPSSTPADMMVGGIGHLVKRSKLDAEHSAGPVCLIGDSSQAVSQVMIAAMERHGWKAVVVRDGEDALRLLKTRNWAAVFLAEDLPRLTGIRCVERFREWEQENRVARQNNLFFLSESLVPSLSSSSNGGGLASNSSTLPPAGFDAVLGKPILEKDLEELIDIAASRLSDISQSGDILAR